MTSLMLGLYQSVRKTPVSSSTTKLHSAISPSMNDQWSGNTLRICFLVAAPMPVRSSAQFAAAPPLLGLAGLAALLAVLAFVLIDSASFPEARAHRLVKVAGGAQVARVVQGQRKLRKRPGSRPEYHFTVVSKVERGLVAGAQQVVG